MTSEQLQTLHTARPFRPFRMHIADGRSLEVLHPEFLARTKGGRTVFVGSVGEHFEIVDLLLVTSLEVLDKPPGSSRRKR